MGKYTSPLEKAGQKCVVKELKENFTWEASDLDMTLKIHTEAQELAVKFSQYIIKYPTTITKSLSFTDIYVLQVIRNPDPNTRPLLNEYVIVEDYIPGEFKKWINNYGFVSKEVSSALYMPAFAHWSWCYTKGERMIADLQGVRSDRGYTLTDPVLMSGTVNGQMYGCTDTGVEGIAMFFFNHKCNELCSNLPTPTFQSLGITQSQIPIVTQQLQQIFNANTAYSNELKLPLDIRSRLVQPLKTIAASKN